MSQNFSREIKLKLDEDCVAIGIDLGTTNSCTFYFDGNEFIVPKWPNGKRLLPSCVQYLQNDEVVVGAAAKINAVRRNTHVVKNSKRIIGRYYSDRKVQEMMNGCGVPISEINGKPVFNIDDDNNYHVRVTPVDVASEIVKAMIAQVENDTQKRVSDVLITYPAHFDNNQRTATIGAVESTGIDRQHIFMLNEPTAAAICYSLENDADNTRVLVYDLGGGTFDVSILRIENGNFDVETYEGDDHLGGVDFDMSILEWMKTKYEEKFDVPLIKPDLPEQTNLKLIQRLLEIAEKAKMNLSNSKNCTLDISGIIRVHSLDDDDDDDGDGDDFELTRDIMNDLIRDKIKQTIRLVEKALSNVNLTADDIDRVILVGGSSRLCIVEEELKSFFKNDTKLLRSVNPDECVAQGACQALIYEYKIKEIIAFSLGQEIVGEKVLAIIPRLSSLPASMSQITYTSEDNMSCAKCDVFEGNAEESGNIEEKINCRPLFPLSYTGFQIKKKGEVSFKTIYTIKETGIVYVTKIEVDTGKILIDNKELKWSDLLLFVY